MKNAKNYALLFIGLTIIAVTLSIVFHLVYLGVSTPAQVANASYLKTFLSVFKWYGIGLCLVVPVLMAIKIFEKIKFD